MANKRRALDSKFKAKVALAAIKGDKTVQELSREYLIHPNQISTWKSKLVSDSANLFQSNIHHDEYSEKEKEFHLQQIGQLKIELEWLKKKMRIF